MKGELEDQTLRNWEAAGLQPDLWTLQPNVQSLIRHLSLSVFLSFYLIINLFYVHVHVFVYVVAVSLTALWHESKDKGWLSSCLGDRLLSKEKEAEGVLIKTTINTVASIKCLPVPISTSLRETHTEHRKLQRFYYCKFNKSKKGGPVCR